MSISWRRIWLTTAVLCGLVLLLGFTEVWQSSLRERARGAPFPWLEYTFFIFPSWILLALFTPAILFLSERFPLERNRFRVSLPVHVIAGVTVAVLHLASTVFVAIQANPRSKFTALLSRASSTYLVYDLLNYWMIVGVAHAIQYYRRFREREMAALTLERSLTEARLQALRGQLNPHFLYNTLNSISTMALKGDQQAVVQTLARLSNLLRATLEEGGGQEVPLRRELELTDLYLDIQQIRFGDRLHIEKEVDPASVDALVPAMILQPLIENAVIHGVCPKPGDAIIRIRSTRVNGVVRLEVQDTGPGFCPAESPHENGIGLANTRARLQQLYGSEQTLEWRNGSNGGATVSITIPFRTRIDSGTDDPDSDRRR